VAKPQNIYTAPGLTINYSSVDMIPISASGPTSASIKIIGLPPGITASLSANSISLTSGTQNLVLTIAASPSVQPGNYQVTVDGVAGASNLTYPIPFTVVPHLVFIYPAGFLPTNLTVPNQSAVTWMNLEAPIVGDNPDPGTNNAVFQGGLTVSSPILQQYQTWTYTFTQSGTFSYTSTVHNYMHGQVTVKP
jgi:plastocyanin